MKAASVKSTLAFVLLLGACAHCAHAQDLNLAQSQAGAAKGDAEAEFDLGKFYAKGQGVPQDYARAVELYRQAAEQGYGKAQNNLGTMYEHGWGVKADQAEAIRWLEKAAAQDLALAQTNLASILMIQAQAGADSDKEKQAIDLYRKAAEQGDLTAQLRLMDIFFFGAKNTEKDRPEAAKWAALAANQGNPQAENTYGVMNEEGLGVPRNMKAAVEWFRKSAEQGDAKGESDYGRMFTTGALGNAEHNPAKAYLWLSLSAMQGEVTARVLLSDYMKAMTPDQITEGKHLLDEFWAHQAREPSPADSPAANMQPAPGRSSGA